MPEQPDFFRDFGIIPFGVGAPPAETIRCELFWPQVIGQYVFTGVMSGLGLGVASLILLTLDFPLNLTSALAAACFGYLVYVATRYDVSWVELDGETLRAKHLYTRRVFERSIADIDHLLTLVYEVRRLETILAEAWLGRVRGVEIRFRDGRTPLRVHRADPAMKNAKELIEAIIYRMSQKGEIDAQVVQFAGKPLIRRINWKSGPHGADLSKIE